MANAGTMPVVASKRGGALVQIKRATTLAWVLHRRIILFVLSAVLVAGVAGGLFYARGGIMSAATTMGHVLSGRFATAGLGISKITLTGQALTSERMIAEALAIDPEMTIFGYDIAEARARLMELPAISEARVSKVYPSQLVVELTEVPPVARWRVDGITFLIGSDGKQLAQADPADTDLPLVIGDGAADDAALIIRVLERHPEIQTGLIALSRIADRRWDFIYDTGLRVQMPEYGVAQAISTLETLQTEQQILARDLDLVDLRVPSILALQVTERAEDGDSE